MKEMKYFEPYKSMCGLQMSKCMISNMFVLLFSHFFDFLVCFPLIQSTQVSKSVKSKVLSTPSFTSILILSIEICHNLQCHNIKESSFITHHLTLV